MTTKNLGLTVSLALCWAFVLGIVGFIRYGKTILSGAACGLFVWWIFSL